MGGHCRSAVRRGRLQEGLLWRRPAVAVLEQEEELLHNSLEGAEAEEE